MFNFFPRTNKEAYSPDKSNGHPSIKFSEKMSMPKIVRMAYVLKIADVVMVLFPVNVINLLPGGGANEEFGHQPMHVPVLSM